MSKSAMVRARVEPDLKANAEDIFEKIGISPTQAITMFYKQVEINSGLPFSLSVPKNTTARTFKATDQNKDLVICKDAQDMFKQLGI